MSASNLIDNFEGVAPAGSYGWQAYKDESAETSIVCTPSADRAYAGAKSMRIDYQIALYTWATCDLTYENPQNWSEAEGISFYAYAEQEETRFNVDLFTEGKSYVYEGWVEGSGEWQEFIVFWDEFRRVDWEEDAGSPFTQPGHVEGLAFGFNTPDGVEEGFGGTLYIDELALGAPASALEVPPEPELYAEPEGEADAGGEDTSGGMPLPCAGGLVLPAALSGFVFWQRKKN